MRAIFISYRRDDAEGEAGRLFDDLIGVFGEHPVFMDVAAIQMGRDFRTAIDESVATCGVLLAIIGRNWLDAKDETGQRRLDSPDDFVRLETASALKRDIPVIPVLVQGARMPRADRLPDDLKELAYRNGIELTGTKWRSDVQVLTNALRPFVEPATEPARQAVVEPAPAPVIETYPKKQRKLPLKPALVVAGVAIVVAIGAYYFFLFGKVTVPDVRGSTLAEAEAKLGAAHLVVGTTRTQIDPSKEPNTVMTQSPSPGAALGPGGKVDLVLSPALVEVPAGQSAGASKKSNSLTAHMMIVSDKDPTLAICAWGGAGPDVILRLNKNCRSDNPDCTWTYRNRMIVSDRDPTLAINAWGGAGPDVVLRLYKNCPPDNPDCTWTYRNGMIFSDTDPTLAINAWGGAQHGTVVRLYKNCPHDNPDCTWAVNTQ